MKVQVLQEGSRPNEIGYHFTNIDGLGAIIDSDFMQATNEPLEDRPISRYRLTFPDGSELNVDELDFFSLGNKQDITKYVNNNRLKDKIEKFNIKSRDEIKYKRYEYTPYKDLIGKPSWSYTRRPEGMSYRNFKTYGDESVRIGIDIHKLTEKGYKVIPFSWERISKKDSDFEFEERVFGDGEKEKGTYNFMNLVTEIAFPFKFPKSQNNLQLCFENILYPTYRLDFKAKDIEKLLKETLTMEQIKKQLHKRYIQSADYLNLLIQDVKNIKIKSVEDLYKISDYSDDDDYEDYDEDYDDDIYAFIEHLQSIIPKRINVIFANPDTGKEVSEFAFHDKNSKEFKKYLEEQINEFLSTVDQFLKYGVSFNDYNTEILSDSRCKKALNKLFSYVSKTLDKMDYYKKLIIQCNEKYNECEEKLKNYGTEVIDPNKKANEIELLRFLKSLPKKNRFSVADNLSTYALVFYNDRNERNMIEHEKLVGHAFMKGNDHIKFLQSINNQHLTNPTDFFFKHLYDGLDFVYLPENSAAYLTKLLRDCPEGSSSLSVITSEKEFIVTMTFKHGKLTISMKDITNN